MLPLWSNTMARVLVVPWSMAITYWFMLTSLSVRAWRLKLMRFDGLVRCPVWQDQAAAVAMIGTTAATMPASPPPTSGPTTGIHE